MLCLRCALFAAFALVFLMSVDPSHNLLAIEAAVIGLLTLTRFTGLIYKNLYLEILEASFILNLGVLAAATYSVRLVTNTSVGVAFATFVGVLVYHAYQQLWPKLQQRIHHLRHCKEHQKGNFDEGGIDNQRLISTLPIVTIVERPSPEPLNSININVSSSSKAQPLIELREPLLLNNTSSH